jgi:hypothetical protein
MMELVSTSEMPVNFYQTTWHHNPEDSHNKFAAVKTSDPTEQYLFSVPYGQYQRWGGEVCFSGHGGGERGCYRCLAFFKY